MEPIDHTLLQELLKPQPRAVSAPKRLKDPLHLGVLGVQIQSDYCNMCQRGDRPVLKKVMYNVNGKPLCSPHAMYVLSCMLMDAGIEFDASSSLPPLPGEL